MTKMNTAAQITRASKFLHKVHEFAEKENMPSLSLDSTLSCEYVLGDANIIGDSLVMEFGIPKPDGVDSWNAVKVAFKISQLAEMTDERIEAMAEYVVKDCLDVLLGCMLGENGLSRYGVTYDRSNQKVKRRPWK